MDPNKMYVIISLGSSKNVAQEQLELTRMLQMPVKRLVDADQKTLYLCEVTKKANMAAYVQIADVYYQDSILVLDMELPPDVRSKLALKDGSRVATVHHVDTNEDEHAGFWSNSGESKPSQETYMVDPQTKEYYTISRNGYKLLNINTLL